MKAVLPLLVIAVLVIAIQVKRQFQYQSEASTKIQSIRKEPKQEISVDVLDIIQPRISEAKPNLGPKVHKSYTQSKNEASIYVPKEIKRTSYPQNIFHQTIEYPAFVLPPPLRTSDMQFPPFMEISTYYQSLMRVSRDCVKDICRNPVKYLSVYGLWDCHKYPNLCQDPSSILIMQENKYLQGDNDVIVDGIIFREYDCGWPADHHINYESKDYSPYGVFDGTLVYLPVPEGMTFQHFIDGTLPKLVQLRHIISAEKNIYLATDMQLYDTIPMLILESLGFSRDHIISFNSLPWIDDKVKVNKLILGCRTPPLHPQLWMDAQELLGLPWLKENWVQTKHIILYLSRNVNTRNSGRQVENEEDILEMIQSFIQNTKYELVVFNSQKYKSLDKLYNFAANVDIVVGPHGGAIYNIIFMRRGITVIEFMPETRSFLTVRNAVHSIIYIQSMLLGNNYFNVLGTRVDQDNMIIDPNIVKSILKMQL